MFSNTKIKIAPSLDEGRILIRILVTCLHLQRTKNSKAGAIPVCLDELGHILKEWHWYSGLTINKHGFPKWISSPKHNQIPMAPALSFLGLHIKTLVYKIKYKTFLSYTPAHEETHVAIKRCMWWQRTPFPITGKFCPPTESHERGHRLLPACPGRFYGQAQEQLLFLDLIWAFMK